MMTDRKGGGLSPGGMAWSMFEGARNPYVVLVIIYVFMPYFANVVVGDPVRGQQAVATYGQWAGIIVALTAPFLGASIDKLGPRKPLLFGVTALMVPLIWSLWFTRADHRGLSVGAVIVIAGALNVLISYSEVLHNSMLVRAAGVRNAHAASALALVIGNAVSVAVLIFVLWAFVLPGVLPLGFIPHAPLFGLDPRSHEPARIVAPIAACILAVGAIPLFLFTPDAPPTGLPIARALAEGGQALMAMLRSLKGQRDATVFLLSRMLYIDAMTAVLLFAGVYAGGVMHWGALPLLGYGILLSILAVLGGVAGGVLDQVVGPKRAVQIEIGATAAGADRADRHGPGPHPVLLALRPQGPPAAMGLPDVPDPAGSGLSADQLRRVGGHHRLLRLQPHAADPADAAGRDRLLLRPLRPVRDGDGVDRLGPGAGDDQGLRDPAGGLRRPGRADVAGLRRADVRARRRRGSRRHRGGPGLMTQDQGGRSPSAGRRPPGRDVA